MSVKPSQGFTSGIPLWFGEVVELTSDEGTGRARCRIATDGIACDLATECGERVLAKNTTKRVSKTLAKILTQLNGFT